MFGGAMTQNQKLFGTDTNSFLTKATTYSAVIFVTTCIVLGILTVRQGRSLVEGRRIKSTFNETAAPALPATAAGAAAAVPANANGPKVPPAAQTGDVPQQPLGTAPASTAPAETKTPADAHPAPAPVAVSSQAPAPAPAASAQPAQEKAPAATAQ
jgi:preprotein translocase subunit SecG